MSLYSEWEKTLKNQTNSTVDAFWEEYSGAEKKIYTDILNHKDEKLTGTVRDLSEKYGVREVIFTGFLDGVQESLKEGCDLDPESVTEETEVALDIDFKALYKNMLKANADHLYTLEAWNNVFTEDERAELTKEYKRSRIYHAPKKIGRNDPCPCGSGKKYKNCCGKNK
ncbi:MAG: SEC-C metal-binding domain-containing protein [Anaerovoracaceae bacterium]|jgi:uncharacterized protein